MDKTPPNIERVEVTARDALWDWLAHHHAQDSGVLLVTFMKHVGAKYLSRDDVLDALVAYGWTDGRRWALDRDRTLQLISPRRTQVWARSYKLRASRLEAEGLMRPPGLAAIARAKAAGLWDVSDPVDDLLVPGDLAQALGSGVASDYYAACPPAYRRNLLRWLHQTKTEATRHKRLQAITEACAAGRRIRHF